MLALAQEEAKRLRHAWIGTEHLILGLLHEDAGVAARVLASLNVTLDEARDRVESIVGYGEEVTGGRRRTSGSLSRLWGSIVGYGEVVTRGWAPYTPRAKKVLELALREALQLGHDYVGAEHILLGLVRESEGVAAHALGNLGVNPDRVRSEVLVVLGKAPDPLDLVEVEIAPEVGGNRVLFQGRVEALEVHVRCGVSDEERALPQTLLVDLEYAYEALDTDDVSGVVDYGVLLEEVAGALEREEFRLLETGARRAGEHVLVRFPAVLVVTVTVTKPRVPVDRVVSGVSVEATFRR